MKSMGWLVTWLMGLLLAGFVYAADTEITVVRVTPSLDLAQAQYILSHQREEVFERGMALDSKQWQVFWRVYDDYEKEKEQLDAKRLRLLGTYVSKHAALTGDDAAKLIKASVENQQADLALRQKYFTILSKKLTPVAAARFAQIDDIVGMVVRLAILGNIQLITDVSDETEPQAEPAQPALPDARE
ncbi:MAG: hypothetical protein KF693_02115 [Nitrospira sp.]|nr:hypothetical protein [Nitrospira sp.]